MPLNLVDCRWSLWTSCEPCKGGDQTRKVTRKRGCNDAGQCGQECPNVELVKQQCPSEKTCVVENPRSK